MLLGFGFPFVMRGWMEGQQPGTAALGRSRRGFFL